MTPAKFRSVREAFGLSLADWARALGYQSKSRQNLTKQICDMESGRKPIPRSIARIVELFERFGIPEDFLKKDER